MIPIAIIIVAIILFLIIACAIAWYRVVPNSEAHMVVTPNKKMVVSPDENVRDNCDSNTYFALPEWLIGFGRKIRIMDVTIKELLLTQETYEEKQARYLVSSSTKYRITNVKQAAETFVDDETLQKMLKEVIQAAVRTVTVKYDVVNARAKKREIAEAVREEMKDDLASWGLQLINFQLIDFQDTKDSSVISDISKRREVEITARTREENAEKLKQARVKEAEAEEKAREREIAKDKVIGQKEQNKHQAIAEQEKLAKEKEFEVVRVKTIRQAEIDKEKAIVKANEEKATEEIIKVKKKLEGEGDKLRDEEKAKGLAAPIREKGLAEALAKEKLQAALNKFKDTAIRALVAELIVDKDKAIGIETAKALTAADLKVFSGSGEGKAGFDLGQLIGGLKSSGDQNSVESLLNRFARPNDLGVKLFTPTEEKKTK